MDNAKVRRRRFLNGEMDDEEIRSFMERPFYSGIFCKKDKLILGLMAGWCVLCLGFLIALEHFFK